MKRSHKRWVLEITEILMSFLIAASAVVLVLDWQSYEYFFIVAFAAAALLFLARGIRMANAGKGSLAGGIFYLIGAMLMIGFLTASILTIWGGNL